MMRPSVIDMTRSAPVFRLASEFDDFLFAPICTEQNGMQISVLSALARLDVDPWQKAAELAGLPGEAAIRWMTSLIASLLDAAPAHPDPGPDAARLIALLPRRASNSLAPSTITVSGHPIAKEWVAALYVALLIGVMGAQFAVSGFQSKRETGEATAPASSLSSAPASAPAGDQ